MFFPKATISRKAKSHKGEKNIMIKFNMNLDKENNFWGSNLSILQKQHGLLKNSLTSVIASVDCKISKAKKSKESEKIFKTKKPSVFSKSVKSNQRKSECQYELSEKMKQLKNIWSYPDESQLKVPIELVFKWFSPGDLPFPEKYSPFLEQYSEIDKFYFMLKIMLRRDKLDNQSENGLSSLSVFLMVLAFFQNQEANYQYQIHHFQPFDLSNNFLSLHNINVEYRKDPDFSQISIEKDIPNTPPNKKVPFLDLFNSDKFDPIQQKLKKDKQKLTAKELLTKVEPDLFKLLEKTDNVEEQVTAPVIKGKNALQVKRKKLSFHSNSFAHASLKGKEDSKKPKKESKFQMKLKNKLQEGKVTPKFEVNKQNKIGTSKMTVNFSQITSPIPPKIGIYLIRSPNYKS